MLNSTLFTAVVITSNAGSRTAIISRESYSNEDAPDGGNNLQGIFVSSALSSFFGFKDSSLPQPGTRVLCVANTGSTCFILGTIPQENLKLDSLPQRATLGQKNALDDQANRMGHVENTSVINENRRCADVVDGEYVIGNEFNVLLGLYQQMAQLKASELAQVQCFLLDDMVRIVSHNFQHYTALGEYNIWHDGKRLMAEFGATHKTGEIYGQPAVNSDSTKPTFTEEGTHTTDDKSDFYKIQEDERIKAIERFKIFLGSVGDFVHLFVVRPDPEETRKNDLKPPNKPDTGLCDVHLGTDGGIHVRSVKEVFIEKTQWIRVPQRIAYPEEKEGDDARTLEYEQKEKFEFKNDHKFKGNPFLYSLQIRDYVAYVNEKLNYQNFKTHEKDFYVNDDIGKENKLNEFGPIDKETKLELQDYQLRTAGIYLMPNGGIAIRDAWSSAIVLEGGNIYLQPAKDLISQPLRHNIIKAGGFMSIASKWDIDFSTTKGGFRVKSKNAHYFYSKDGGVVFQTDGTSDTPGTPDPETMAIEKIGGIVFKSKLGIYNFAEKVIMNHSKDKILFESMKHIDLRSKQDITFYPDKRIWFLTDEDLLIYSPKSLHLIAGNQVNVAGTSGTNLGQKDDNLGIMYDTDSIFIDILKGVIPTEEFKGGLDQLKEAKKELLKLTTFSTLEKVEKLKFKFLKSNQYGQLSDQEDAIPMTMAQQEDLSTSLYSLQDWEEEEVNESLPYPGKDKFEQFYFKGEKPKNLETNPLGKDSSNKADAEPETGNITLASLKQYKVQKSK